MKFSSVEWPLQLLTIGIILPYFYIEFDFILEKKFCTFFKKTHLGWTPFWWFRLLVVIVFINFSSSSVLPSFSVERLIWKAKVPTKIKAFILLVAKRKLNNMENLQKRIKESQIRHWIQIVVLCVGGRKGYRSPFLALQFYARLMDLAF